MWKGDHHVINDVVLLGQGGSFPTHWKRHCLLGTDNWIVGHVINFCIDILLLISTPRNIIMLKISFVDWSSEPQVDIKSAKTD